MTKKKRTPEQREKQRRINFLNSIRKAFIFTDSFKDTFEKAKVGTKYKCAICNKLWPKATCQVDHYPEPVTPRNKRQYQLSEQEIIDRVLNSEVRILCKNCHKEDTERLKKERV